MNAETDTLALLGITLLAFLLGWQLAPWINSFLFPTGCLNC